MKMILVARTEGAKPFNVSLTDQYLSTPHLVKLDMNVSEIIATEQQGVRVCCTLEIKNRE